MDYAEETRLKAQRVKNCLNRIGGENLAEVPILAAPDCHGYQMCIRDRGKRCQLPARLPRDTPIQDKASVKPAPAPAPPRRPPASR